jgi:regulator of sigma E protease
MTILIFFAVLFILILVHEWGHFIVAKKTGMRVDEFGIGFPPKLFGIKKGETEYTFNALPIGGFVRIWGENFSEDNETAENQSNSRAFGARPKWAQALVLIAGVTMNILFAWFLFSLTFMIGVQAPVDESVATDAAQLYITGVLPDSPAAELPAWSIVTAVTYNEQEIINPSPSEFSDAVVAAGGSPVVVSYLFEGTESVTTLQPTQGLIPGDSERYAVGVALSLVEIQKQSFFSAIGSGFTETWNGLKAISVGLYSLIAQAIAGNADFSQVAGPIGIVGMVGDAAAFGITALLTFTAVISLNLAVINLLPFPALDGGRLLFVLVESITGRPIPPVWAGRLNLIGFGMLMLLMIAVTYNDIVRLL